jgi:hypothetical protein
MMDRDFICSPGILMGLKRTGKLCLLYFQVLHTTFDTGAKLGNKREKILLQEKAASIKLCMPVTIMRCQLSTKVVFLMAIRHKSRLSEKLNDFSQMCFTHSQPFVKD